MLNARFAELTQKPDAPFVFGFGGRGGFLARTKEIAFLNAVVKEDGVERGMQALLTEAERVARFGFTETELARQKENVLRNYERQALEKDNTLASSRAGEYVRNFLINETLPSADDEYALHQRFLPEITLAEINKLGRDCFPFRKKTGLVIVSGPKKAGVTMRDEEKLAALIKDSAAA